MTSKLIETVTKELLEKFGAGAHKPGSGSAAALDGMIASQLLITVIDLTNKPKRSENYKAYLADLLKIREDIVNRLYPALEQLFQEDSDCFDKVIGLRRERDKVSRHKNWTLYKEKSLAVDAALRIATELPLRIAQICYELGKYAGFVFDYGFQSARGDSGVALHGAISVMGGCLSIIGLNLSQLPGDIWMAKIRGQVVILKEQYSELTALGTAKLEVLEQEAEDNWQYQQAFEKFRSGNLGRKIKSDHEMEILVRELQNNLFIHHEKIWEKEPITQILDVLNPRVVIQKVLGYNYREEDSLGMFTIGNELFEVAGMIDKNQGLVSISRQFPEEVSNFTAAHELAHVLLHEQTVLHRDRPVDGASNLPKPPLEQQADKFAALFLMPATLVKKAIRDIFEVEKLYITESTVLALGVGSIRAFKAKCRDQRGFANVIAQTELYGGKPFKSLAKLFKVSVGAMAIRLIELDLVVF